MQTLTPDVLAELKGRTGLITLNRPRALNALTLPMLRALHAILDAWRDDPQVLAVAIRGMGKEGPFGAFCAGGDIRYFHQAAHEGSPELERYFDQEYSLDFKIHGYPKPYIAFMDGVVMGGGMGISQGARWRLVTPDSRLAMPETLIGLFPDVAGGYFLSRCSGRAGEYLGLTGESVLGRDAIALGLADAWVSADQLTAIWEGLSAPFENTAALELWLARQVSREPSPLPEWTEPAARFFDRPDVPAILAALEQDDSTWARTTAAVLRQRSPLMLHVVLEQIRRARHMSLADELRMERVMMHRAFAAGANSEAVEGIRALAIDKDRAPRWQHVRAEDVPETAVQAFFSSPWSLEDHPLRRLG